MRRVVLSLAGLGVAGLGLYAARRSLAARLFGLRAAEHAIAIERDVPIRMPDGATLYADRLFPRAAGSFPTVLIRTPYGRPSEAHVLGPLAALGAHLFAERGYNVVIQSVRGRFGSEGEFEPFVQEAADGRATMEWVAAQPWFDGNLGLWGPSYLGYVQWAVAADAPPYLKALVPIVTSSRFSRLFYPDGGFAFESSLRWVHLTGAMVGRNKRMDLQTLWRLGAPATERSLREAMAEHGLAQADQRATGASVAAFQRWLSDTDTEGEYWRSIDHHRTLGRITAPVHLVAGWHDIFLNGQLADYVALLADGRQPYLTVLPYAHTDSGLVLAGVREGLWWFDAHLKGQQALLERRPVRLYLMGAHEYHEMNFWPPPAQTTRLYLHAGGLLGPELPAPNSPPDHYRYDPRAPTPSLGGPVLSRLAGPRDQRPLELRSDVLTYTSAPLEADVDVIGPVRLELFVHSSAAHTDFVARLCDVYPDGRSLNVCEGLSRIVPGKGEPQEDGSLRIEIDMWATAQRFLAGHRVRLHVCSGAHPRWSANMGDGAPLGAGVPGPPAEQTIYHDPTHAAALVLPIVPLAMQRAMAQSEYEAAET